MKVCHVLYLFFAGADVLTGTMIEVRFVPPVNEFSRTPVAHTCGSVVEIPNTYCSATEFAEEFGNILQSNVWVMDFV